MRRVLVVVSGMVQGVGFRYYTRSLARQLKLSGFVRNIQGGRVEAQAQGAEDDIGEFIRGLRTGPSQAVVSGIEVEDIPATGQESGFDIRF